MPVQFLQDTKAKAYGSILTRSLPLLRGSRAKGFSPIPELILPPRLSLATSPPFRDPRADPVLIYSDNHTDQRRSQVR
jgi:hypothetical protein